MSTMKQQHAWHIQNLIETEDDCLVVLLSAAEHLESKYAAVCQELKCAQNDIELRDRQISELTKRLAEIDHDHYERIPKLKAEAIREAVRVVGFDDLDDTEGDLLDYADKLEQGK